MQEPRFAIRGTTLRTVFGASDANELVIPENVTEIQSFGNLRSHWIKIYLPDGVTAMPSFYEAWGGGNWLLAGMPLVALMVRPGTPAEATARRGGWPYEIIDDGEPGEAPPAPPEFKLRGTTLTAYIGDDEDVTLPGGVTDVGPFAFMGNKALKRLILPEGVVRIHTAAFAWCARLAQVRLPESLREVRAFAFFGCRLDDEPICLPEGLASVGPKGFFSLWARIERIPAGLIPGLSGGPFSGCHVIQRVDVPEGLDHIPDSAFDGCIFDGGISLPRFLRGTLGLALDEARELAVPEGVETAALTLRKAESLTLPRSVRRLYLVLDEATEFEVPEGVELADLTLPKVKSLTLPRSLRRLELQLGAATELTLPAGVKSVDLCLHQVRKLTLPEGVEHAIIHYSPLLERVDLPDSLRGMVSFDHCSSLKRLRVPEGVAALRNDCFNECHALERVELPASVTMIESCAFTHETGAKLRAVVAAPEGSCALEYAKQKGLNWEVL